MTAADPAAHGLRRIEDHKSFGGRQQVWEHDSTATGTPMRFSLYLPPQAEAQAVPVLWFLSGLTCTEQNFITKAGAQAAAATHRRGAVQAAIHGRSREHHR